MMVPAQQNSKGSGEPTNALAATREATATLMEALEDTRQTNAIARADRLDVERAPVSLDDALRRVDAWIASLDTSLASQIAWKFTAPNFRQPNTSDLPELLLAASAEPLAAYLKQRIADAYNGRTGLSDRERTDRLAKIDAEIWRLELVEEAMIRSAEAAGFEILRRGEADPHAVLADDESLP